MSICNIPFHNKQERDVIPAGIQSHKFLFELKNWVHCFRGKLVCMQKNPNPSIFHKILGGHHMHIFRR